MLQKIQRFGGAMFAPAMPVSYTHPALPTNREVSYPRLALPMSKKEYIFVVAA